MKTGWMIIRIFVVIYILAGTLLGVRGQVVVNQTENQIPIQEIRLQVNGVQTVQTTNLASRSNPLPDRAPVTVETILLADGTEIFATTRTPTVTNLHPRLGTAQIPANGVGVANFDGTYISHMSTGFVHAIEEVVSTPDFRSYWDIGGSNIPANEVFMDVIYPVEVPKSGYLVVSERDGNSSMNFQALGINGQPIASAQTIQLRGYPWNTRIVNQGNYPTQPQHLVVFSPQLFGTNEAIYGIRIINVDGADGKIVFFRNSISVQDDFVLETPPGIKNVVNVLLNDEVKEQPATVETVMLSVIDPEPNGWIRLNPDGTVDVSPDAEAGTYVITYQITEIGNLSNSAYGSVTIEVITSLPVKWLGVSAEEIDWGANVSWSVAQERNNEKFQVLRSIDGGRSFVLAGEIPGAQYSTGLATYKFFDADLPAQANVYYLITQVDSDGQSSSSEVFKLSRHGLVPQDIRVYPNPYLGGSIGMSLSRIQEKQLGAIWVKAGNGNLLIQMEGILGEIRPLFLDAAQELDPGFYLIQVFIADKTEIIKWVKK